MSRSAAVESAMLELAEPELEKVFTVRIKGDPTQALYRFGKISRLKQWPNAWVLPLLNEDETVADLIVLHSDDE
jgi:hypothetical protein